MQCKIILFVVPSKKWGREQSISVRICISIRYKFDLFVVRCHALLLQILRCAQNDRDCHPERSRRRSEGSGASDWFSTLAATGDFKGDMHPDDATGSVYHGSPAHISRPPLGLCLCQSGRCLHRHWQMEKVEEQIPSWRIVVLCAETQFCRRLCARTFQYMLCMASSVRRGVSPATPLRTGFIDSLPELHTIPVFPSIVFHVKLCLSLISHTGFCR